METNASIKVEGIVKKKKKTLGSKLYGQRYLMLLLLPCLAYYAIFKYIPIYGIIIAFKKFEFNLGIFNSPWVGLKYFKQFISGPYFWRLLRNTFTISFYQLLFGFPVPIIFALLLNELKSKTFKRSVQTVSYLPHFISVVIVIGLMKQMLSPTTGIVNMIIQSMGGEAVNFLMEGKWFKPLYIISGIWQSFGWSAIIYIASISSIDTALYEAATIDGAGRWKCMWNITLPGIAPTIIILLILRLGHLLDVGYEKILLMYNPGIYEYSDVISTYVYRNGIQNANYSFGAAVGLMNSVIAFLLILIANHISRKVSETSLW